MYGAEDLPCVELLLVHAILERSDGAHAPVCLDDQLFTRELHIAYLQAVTNIIRLQNGRVLIWVN
jgi:hypothetical protein